MLSLQYRFVLVNSMAFDQDGCSLCERAEQELEQVARKLKCLSNESDQMKCEHPITSDPFILQVGLFGPGSILKMLFLYLLTFIFLS